jgi:hypothetical protein
MDAICISETSVDFYLTTRRYIPEDKSLHSHFYEKFKSSKLLNMQIKKWNLTQPENRRHSILSL